MRLKLHQATATILLTLCSFRLKPVSGYPAGTTLCNRQQDGKVTGQPYAQHGHLINRRLLLNTAPADQEDCSPCSKFNTVIRQKDCSCVWPLRMQLVVNTTAVEEQILWEDSKGHIKEGLALQDIRQLQWVEAISCNKVGQVCLTFDILPWSGLQWTSYMQGLMTDTFRQHLVSLGPSIGGLYAVSYAGNMLGLVPTTAAAIQTAQSPPPGTASPEPSWFGKVISTPKGWIKSHIWVVVLVGIGVVSLFTLICYFCCCRCCCGKKKTRRGAELLRDPGEMQCVTVTRPASASTTPLYRGSLGSDRPASMPRRTSTNTSLTQLLLPDCHRFTYKELQNATGDFASTNVLGEGGFGRVYSGRLRDGTAVAVKRLDRDGMQGDREFAVEINTLAKVRHANLVTLLGICVEGHHRLGVYAHMKRGNLRSLLDSQSALGDARGQALDWRGRIDIALGAARGLGYLHEVAQPQVIHRDLKSSNILIDDFGQACVADFGLARTMQPVSASQEGTDHDAQHTTTVMGTFGYVAPEYAATGRLSAKSDVYSFGVVLLELLTGAQPVDMARPAPQRSLVEWLRPLLADPEALARVLDPALGVPPAVPGLQLATFAEVAEACLAANPAERPRMVRVVAYLEGIANYREETAATPSPAPAAPEMLPPFDSPPMPPPPPAFTTSTNPMLDPDEPQQTSLELARHRRGTSLPDSTTFYMESPPSFPLAALRRLSRVPGQVPVQQQEGSHHDVVLDVEAGQPSVALRDLYGVLPSVSGSHAGDSLQPSPPSASPAPSPATSLDFPTSFGAPLASSSSPTQPQAGPSSVSYVPMRRSQTGASLYSPLAAGGRQAGSHTPTSQQQQEPTAPLTRAADDSPGMAGSALAPASYHHRAFSSPDAASSSPPVGRVAAWPQLSNCVSESPAAGSLSGRTPLSELNRGPMPRTANGTPGNPTNRRHLGGLGVSVSQSVDLSPLRHGMAQAMDVGEPKASPSKLPQPLPESQPGSTNSSFSERGVCLVCLDGPRDWQVLPCRHAVACHGCSRVLKEAAVPCPVCRGPVSGLVYAAYQQTFVGPRPAGLGGGDTRAAETAIAP